MTNLSDVGIYVQYIIIYMQGAQSMSKISLLNPGFLACILNICLLLLN